MEKEDNCYYEPTIKTSKKENYYQVDYANEVTKLNVEKQQLISFLEDKIKEYKEYIDTYKKSKIGNCKLYCEAKLFVYQEVLDFVNKGGNK